MELYTRTYPSLSLQLAQYFGITLPILDHSTLNEALEIQTGASLGTNELPRVSYFCIGNRGHASETGINDFPLFTNKIHRARDTGFFNQIPFVLRPVDNDLTPQERADYGLRKIIDKNGSLYVGYYAKRIDKTGLSIKVENRNIDAQQNVTITPFVPSSDDLKPEPVDLSNGGVNTVKGKYISSTVSLIIPITAFDAEEIINACEILFGSQYYALISEMALVSGVDRNISVSDCFGGVFNFNEVICAQIADHIPVIQPVFSQRGGFTIAAEVGGVEPLLNLSLVNP